MSRGQLVGYIRVSTEEQNTARQEQALADTQRKLILAHHSEWTEITADALMEMVKGLNLRKPD